MAGYTAGGMILRDRDSLRLRFTRSGRRSGFVNFASFFLRFFSLSWRRPPWCFPRWGLALWLLGFPCQPILDGGPDKGADCGLAFGGEPTEGLMLLWVDMYMLSAGNRRDGPADGRQSGGGDSKQLQKAPPPQYPIFRLQCFDLLVHHLLLSLWCLPGDLPVLVQKAEDC